MLQKPAGPMGFGRVLSSRGSDTRGKLGLIFYWPSKLRAQILLVLNLDKISVEVHLWIEKNGYLQEHNPTTLHHITHTTQQLRPKGSKESKLGVQLSKPLNWYWWARRSSGLRQIKKLRKNQIEQFCVTFKFCFIQDLQIPNFYKANFDMDHFWRLLRSP